MYKILIADKIPDSAMELLHLNTNYDVHSAYGLENNQLIKEINSFHGLIVRSATHVSKEIIDAAGNLKVIGRAGSGLDNIDVSYARSKGIAVFNTPGSNAQAVAELTIAMMFSLSRQIYPAVSSIKSGRWEKSSLTGSEISGKTIGLIGFGQIGQKVGQMAAGLDVFEKEPPSDHTLIKHERVIATPHIGGATSESQLRVGEDIVKAIMGHLETHYLFL